MPWPRQGSRPCSFGEFHGKCKLAVFHLREGPIEPGCKRFDLGGFHRRSAPDAKTRGRRAIAADVVGDVFLFQDTRDLGSRRRLRQQIKEWRNGEAYSLFLFTNEGRRLAGGINLSNVRRGVAQTASVGYWMGQPFAGQGLMTDALRAILPFVFDELRLHRLEAACLPTNAASIALLEKAGFRREGYAREYLCINGVWADHLLYARLRND